MYIPNYIHLNLLKYTIIIDNKKIHPTKQKTFEKPIQIINVPVDISPIVLPPLNKLAYAEYCVAHMSFFVISIKIVLIVVWYPPRIKPIMQKSIAVVTQVLKYINIGGKIMLVPMKNINTFFLPNLSFPIPPINEPNVLNIKKEDESRPIWTISNPISILIYRGAIRVIIPPPIEEINIIKINKFK